MPDTASAPVSSPTNIVIAGAARTVGAFQGDLAAVSAPELGGARHSCCA